VTSSIGTEKRSRWAAITGIGTVVLVILTVAVWQGWHAF
jgi:hypothetical protein